MVSMIVWALCKIIILLTMIKIEDYILVLIFLCLILAIMQ